MFTLRPALLASVILVSAPALAQEPPATDAARPEAPSDLPPPSDVQPPGAAPEAPNPELSPNAPPPHPESAPPGAVEPIVAEPTFAEPPAPTALTVGKSGGYWQPSALLQGWAFMSHQDETTSTLRVRRAELKMKGEIVPGIVGYTVMIDPAKVLPFTAQQVPVQEQEPEPTVPGQVTVLQPGPDRSILQDFFITFITEYADVSIGQFKNPVSLEGYGSTSRLILPERARSSTFYGDRRDLGLRIEKKIGKQFYYYAGVFNGTGLNRLDEDNDKDAALRLEFYPLEGLTLGVVGYATVGSRDEQVRDRLEADVRYEAHDILVQAEYIRGWTGPGDDPVEGHGGYGALGYTLLERIQPVVRIGFLNPSLDASGDRLMQYDAGINYLLRGHEMKLSLQGSLFHPEQGEDRIDGILAAQVSF